MRLWMGLVVAILTYSLKICLQAEPTIRKQRLLWCCKNQEGTKQKTVTHIKEPLVDKRQ